MVFSNGIMAEEIRILILEELPARAALIEAQLQEADVPFISKIVQTRDDFIRELHDFAPDVILSAFYLPAFTGSEALAIVQKEAPGVPLILITGKLKEEHWVEVLTEGAAYVLEDKLSKLPSILQRVLRRAKDKRERTE
jgi:DNA-binding NtrC family response regulator